MKLITLNRIIYYNLPKTIIYIPLSFKVNEEKVRCSLRDRLIGTYPTDICPNISAMPTLDQVLALLSQHLTKNCDKMYCLNFAAQSKNDKPTLDQTWANVFFLPKHFLVDFFSVVFEHLWNLAELFGLSLLNSRNPLILSFHAIKF